MKGLSARDLKYMRQFAAAWPGREIVPQPVSGFGYRLAGFDQPSIDRHTEGTGIDRQRQAVVVTARADSSRDGRLRAGPGCVRRLAAVLVVSVGGRQCTDRQHLLPDELVVRGRGSHWRRCDVGRSDRYTVRLTATASGKNSTPSLLHFTIAS